MIKNRYSVLRTLLLLLLCFSLLLTGCGRRSSAEKHVSHRRGASSATIPTERPTSPAPTTEPELIAPVPVPVPTRKEPLIYDGSRPDYSRTDPVWELQHFEWESQSGTGTMWIEFYIDKEMYRYFKNTDRIFALDRYYQYVNDPANKELISKVIDGMREATKNLGYEDDDVAREIAAFVQDTIEYAYDIDTTGMQEYPRYPVETLYERRGDCEDTSILMAAMLKEWGYEVGLLHLPGHLAAAIRTSDDYDKGSYYELNGHRYLYIETTGSGFHIGEIPQQEINEQAELFLIP